MKGLGVQGAAAEELEGREHDHFQRSGELGVADGEDEREVDCRGVGLFAWKMRSTSIVEGKVRDAASRASSKAISRA